MSTLMQDVARLYRAEPEAMKAVVKVLRDATKLGPDNSYGQAYAHALGSVEGTLNVIDTAIECEARLIERRAAASVVEWPEPHVLPGGAVAW